MQTPSATNQTNPNGWAEYRYHVLSELERNDARHLAFVKDDAEQKADLRKDIADLKTEMAIQKLKSGIWGAVAGLIPSIGVLLYMLIEKAGK